jgi:hypothetical protein
MLGLDSKWEEAERFLAEHCPTTDGVAECLTQRLDVASRLQDKSRLTSAVDDLRASCGGAATCALAESAIARQYLALGWRREALGPLRRSAELVPGPGAWLDVARLAVELGLRAEARRAIQNVLQNEPNDALAKEARALDAELKKSR